MSAFLAALGFLTIAPVPASAASASRLGAARGFFPLVGLLLGLTLAGVDAGLRAILPVSIVSALLVLLLILLTRGLHLDGLADTADGVMGGHTRERRLEIMRDPHVGAFGVGVTACVVLLKWAALASLAGPPRFWVIALFPVLSRWAMMLALSAFQYARSQGLGTVFQNERPALGVGLATATAAGAAFLLATWGGLVMLGAAYITAVALGALLARLLGGLTGDTYGAINEVTEVAALMVAVGLMPIDWLRPVTQL